MLLESDASLLNLTERLHRALELEEEASHTNKLGSRFKFSEFVALALEKLSGAYSLRKLSELSKQFSFYESSGLAERIELIKKLRHELKELEEELKAEIQEEEKPEEVEQKFLPQKRAWFAETKWLKGVGDKFALVLKKLGIETVCDLFFYFPREHLNFSKRVQVADLKTGMNATIIGEIIKVSAFKSPKNPNLNILTVRIKDETGIISLSRFIAGRAGDFLVNNFRKQYKEGSSVMVCGTAQFGRQTRYELTNYSIELIDSELGLDALRNERSGKFISIYPLTEGVSQHRLRKVIAHAFEKFGEDLEEKNSLRINDAFMPLKEAIQNIHSPTSEEALEKAEERLAFEEFLLMQIPLAKRMLTERKGELVKKNRKTEIKKDGLIKKYLDSLSFRLTGAQNRVFNEILKDLSGAEPMQRLVQGDVGSGKTVIAVLTMLIAVERGYQAAMMVPTEILAKQHFEKIQTQLLELGIKVELLVGSQGLAKRREILTGLSNGQIHIVIGTHALIQDGVEFANLGLAIVDEQHRFGIRQREKLREKGAFDCLYMTATPIPRTLALSLYGNLDLSEIDEMPPGRKPILTKIASGRERPKIQTFVKSQLDLGRQAYIIYPLIEESDALSAKAITEEFEKMQRIYSGYKIGMVHGKMTTEEKDESMRKFKDRELQILLGTTVIEVGVDIPNATVMIIEDSERFGVSQLHQLRGRIGRGSEQSYCFLFGDTRSERLKIMEETENGFLIAQKDMELRGPGELIGDRQSGVSDFGLKNLIKYSHLLELAKTNARELVKKDAELSFMSELFLYRLSKLEQKIELLSES